METAAILLIFVLFFAGLISLLVRRVWKRFRMIAVAIPVGSDWTGRPIPRARLAEMGRRSSGYLYRTGRRGSATGHRSGRSSRA
jgi:hypothetical protein